MWLHSIKHIQKEIKMKRIIKIITSILIITILAGIIFAYNGNNLGNGNSNNLDNGIVKGKGYGKNQGGQTYQLYDDTQINHQSQIDQYPIEELSQDEIDGLILMREEEKLARDVYQKLYEIWGQQIFSNIAKSESTHTAAIKSLLEKYNITDPMTTDEMGIFENQELQTLYDNLVNQGSTSLVAALKVGATIEDLDIKDLQELNNISDNQDISAVYDNLEKGSRNHLRSFVKLIENNGETYEPQYITQDYYDSIISSDMERGNNYNTNSKSNSNSKSNINANDNMNNNQNRNNNEETNPQNQIRNSENTNSQNNNQNTQNSENQEYQNQNSNQEQSQNIIAKMWRGLKSWFN